MSGRKEEWKPVVGWDGYEVSNRGRVRSLDRRVKAANGYRNYKGRVLSTHLQGPRPDLKYVAVGLSRPGESGKPKLVHRLVLEAFQGPCPAGCKAQHLDGDLTNNRLTNLRWANGQQLAAAMEKAGVLHSTLSSAVVREVRRMHKQGRPQTEIAKHVGVHSSTICRILKGHTWRHVK